MITSSDSALILFSDCKRIFGLPTYLKGNEPRGEVKAERIVIKAKPQTEDDRWLKNFVEVNIVIPDEPQCEPNLVRLQEVERIAQGAFKGGVTGEYDNAWYYYVNDSIGTEDDTQLRCHYVNCRILFKTLNV